MPLLNTVLPIHGEFLRSTFRCKVRIPLAQSPMLSRDCAPDKAPLAEATALALADHIRTLATWFAHDMLALSGPDLQIRHGLFDFIVAKLTGASPSTAFGADAALERAGRKHERMV